MKIFQAQKKRLSKYSSTFTYIFDKVQKKRDHASDVVKLIHLTLLHSLNGKRVIILTLSTCSHLKIKVNKKLQVNNMILKVYVK